MMQKNERGRSMVEMLGVLAVIGVLSIGGIAGYQTAMNRHKANEWLNNYEQFKVLEKVARERAMQNINEEGWNMDYLFESNGFKVAYLNSDDRIYGFNGPSLHNKEVCKMVLELVDPKAELNLSYSAIGIGNKQIEGCYEQKCVVNICEEATDFSGEFWFAT